MKSKALYVHSSIILITVFTLLNELLSMNGGKYTFMFLLPFGFLITYPFYIKILEFNDKIKLTVLFVLSFNFLRLVVIPLYSCFSVSYFKNSIDGNSINKAILFLTYENIIVTLLLLFLFQINSTSISKKNINLKGNTVIYILFILFAFSIYMLFGRGLELFDFVIKSVGTEERAGDMVDGKLLIIRQIISSSFIFAFFIIVNKTSRKFQLNNKRIYLVIAIISALFMVSLITGERRTTQLYVGFATTLVLVSTFPSKRKQIINIILSGVLFVLILMTIYKHFNAFLYDSYLTAVQSSSVSETISASTLDSYFYGLNTVSRNIEFGITSKLNLINFIHDFFRSVFGLNFFIGKDSLTTTEIYNSSIYWGTKTSGYLFSSVAYGYIYFGCLFAPFATCFNIIIAFVLERKMRLVVSIEMTYILAFLFMRFAFGMFGDPTPLLNLSTRYIFINGSIFLAAYFLNFKIKKHSHRLEGEEATN